MTGMAVAREKQFSGIVAVVETRDVGARSARDVGTKVLI
jgi:hypothetical protein